MPYQEELRDYISHDQPFGPIDAEDIQSPDMMEELFDQQNRVYRELISRPSIIIGRRGSGKTASLRSLLLNERYTDAASELKTPELFTHVTQLIERTTHDRIFVETMAD